MNWRFWFFGKAAGTGNPTREHAAAPKQPASHPTQIIVTLSDEDRTMFKSQHEQVMTKLNEKMQPENPPTLLDVMTIRKDRIKEMTKILLCFGITCLLVPYWMTTNTITPDMIPFATFIGTASICGFAMILSYFIKDAECFMPTEPSNEEKTPAECAYKAIWHNLPAFIFIAFLCCFIHLIAIAQEVDIAHLQNVLYLIMTIYSIIEIINSVCNFFKMKYLPKARYIVIVLARVACGYSFYALFLITSIT